MKEFKMSTKQIEMEKRKILIYAVPLMLIALIIGLFSGNSESDYSGNMYVILLPVVLLSTIAIVIGIRFGNKIIDDSLTSYKIELLDTSIRKSQKNAPVIEIEMSEVISITEVVNKGITIKTNNITRYIFIPVHVEGYSELKESLSEWMNITRSERNNNFFLQIISAVGIVLGFAIIMLCDYSYIVIPVGIVMIIVLIWNQVMIQINPHIDTKIKKIFLIIIFPVILILLKVLSFIL